MDEESVQPQEFEPQPEPETPKTPRKRRPILKVALIVLVALALMVGSAAGAYWWRDNDANNTEKQLTDNITEYQARIANLESQLATANSTDDDDAVCVEVAPNASAIENIKASITSGNTAALEGYMASSVNVILAATEAYGAQTPSQAVASISDFLSDNNLSWDYDFDLPSATLTAYQQGDYSEYFPNTAIVGKASNNQVISFSFDCNGKIDTVFLATSQELL